MPNVKTRVWRVEVGGLVLKSESLYDLYRLIEGIEELSTWWLEFRVSRSRP